MATTRISIAVDDEMLAEARELAPDGDVSGFLHQLLVQRVKTERMREYLAAREAESGPIPEHLRARVREQWPA